MKLTHIGLIIMWFISLFLVKRIVTLEQRIVNLQSIVNAIPIDARDENGNKLTTRK
jgi:hypothetical protein